MSNTQPVGFGNVFPSAETLKMMPATMQQEAALLAAERRAERRLVLAASNLEPEPETSIELGVAGIGGTISLDIATMLDGRLLVQGTSGAGKSWTLRRVLEQTFGRIQQIIIDPEGEFRGLAKHYGHLLLEAHRLDPHAVAVAASRARQHRLSILLDLSDLERVAQLRMVSSFLTALIDAPESHWHPTLVVIDEAHLFAPVGSQTSAPDYVRRASINAITDLMSRGRKRGLCSVLATQRLARLAKSVASEFLNFLVGLNTLDLDIRRAAETIGWDTRRAFDRLPMLTAGDFVAVGPAFSMSPAVLRIGGVETEHHGSRPDLSAPERRDVDTAAELLELEDLLSESSADAEIRDENALPLGLKSIRAFIREPAFADCGRVWGTLRPLAPEGARISELADYLELAPDAVSAALALLDQFGVVEFMGEGDDRAARVCRGMAP